VKLLTKFHRIQVPCFVAYGLIPGAMVIMDLNLGFFGFVYMCMRCIVRHRFASALAMMHHCLFEGRASVCFLYNISQRTPMSRILFFVCPLVEYRCLFYFMFVLSSSQTFTLLCVETNDTWVYVNAFFFQACNTCFCADSAIKHDCYSLENYYHTVWGDQVYSRYSVFCPTRIELVCNCRGLSLC